MKSSPWAMKPLTGRAGSIVNTTALSTHQTEGERVDSSWVPRSRGDGLLGHRPDESPRRGRRQHISSGRLLLVPELAGRGVVDMGEEPAEG